MLIVTQQCLALAYLNGAKIFAGGQEDEHFDSKSGKPINTKANKNIETIRNLVRTDNC